MGIVKKSIKTFRWMPEIEEKWSKVEKERQWIIATMGDKKLAICNCYMAAEVTCNQNFIEWNDLLYEMLSSEIVKLKADNHMIVLAGDMNAHIGKRLRGTMDQNNPKINKNGAKLLQFIKAHDLKCENTKEKSGKWCTWSANRGDLGIVKSCIDYCLTFGITNLPKEFNILDEEQTHIDSDHKLIQLKVKIPRMKKKKKKLKKKMYTLGKMKNVDAYKTHAYENLKKIPIEKFKYLTQKQQIEHIERSVLKAATHVYPPTRKMVKSSLRKLSKEIRDDIKRKREYYSKIVKEEATEEEVKEYQTLKRNIKRRVLKERGSRKRARILSLYQEDPDMRLFWGIMKNKSEQGLVIEALRNEDGESVYRMMK